MGEFKPPVPGAPVSEAPAQTETSPEREQREKMKSEVVALLSGFSSRGVEAFDADMLLSEMADTESAEAIRHSPEVQAAAMQGMVKAFSIGKVSAGLDIIRDFKIPESVIVSAEMKSVALESALVALQNGSLSLTHSLAEKFHFAPEFFQDPQTIEAAKAGVEKLLSGKTPNHDIIKKIKDKFGV